MENRICYSESEKWFSFTRLMNNAHLMKWTGVIAMEWKPKALTSIFHLDHQERMRLGTAYVFLSRGTIINVCFSLRVSVELLDEKVSMSNLLLLIRAFEGIGDQPKLKARVVYAEIPDVLQLPNILNLPANLVTSYSLLAEEQALKDKAAFREWPEIIG